MPKSPAAIFLSALREHGVKPGKAGVGGGLPSGRKGGLQSFRIEYTPANFMALNKLGTRLAGRLSAHKEALRSLFSQTNLHETHDLAIEEARQLRGKKRRLEDLYLTIAPK